MLIALPGEEGTRSEIALARVIGRPVVLLGGWRLVRGVARARTPREAVRRALVLAGYERRAAGGRRRGAGAGLR